MSFILSGYRSINEPNPRPSFIWWGDGLGIGSMFALVRTLVRMGELSRAIFRTPVRIDGVCAFGGRGRVFLYHRMNYISSA